MSTEETTGTIPVAGDPATKVSVALRRLWDNNPTCAEQWLRELDDEQLRQASTMLRRLAVLVETIRFEDLTARLPSGVDGFPIHGRACPECGRVDCQWRGVHAAVKS